MNVLQEIEKAEREVESARAVAYRINFQIGSEMRKRRIQANKSVRQVAKELNCSPPWISDLERGRRGWTSEWVSKFEAILEKVA